MTITVGAVYENGVLKPAQPLPLKEHEAVRITIAPQTSWAQQTAGLLQWTGDPDVLRRLAEDPEFGILESAAVISRAEQTAGMMGWTGTADEADYFATDPELEFPPP